MPNSNILPPIGERQVGLGVSFGVPTPPPPIKGQFSRGNDASPEPAAATGGEPRPPSLGATVRLPF